MFWRDEPEWAVAKVEPAMDIFDFGLGFFLIISPLATSATSTASFLPWEETDLITASASSSHLIPRTSSRASIRTEVIRTITLLSFEVF